MISNKCIALLREHNKEASIVTTDWKEIDGSKILEIMEQKKTLSAELDRLREEAYREQAEHEAEHHHHDHEHHHHDDEEHECCGHGHHHHHHHGHGHHADEVFDEMGVETAHRFSRGQLEQALAGSWIPSSAAGAQSEGIRSRYRRRMVRVRLHPR